MCEMSKCIDGFAYLSGRSITYLMCKFVYMWVCMYVYAFVCMRVCACVCIHVCANACMCMYVGLLAIEGPKVLINAERYSLTRGWGRSV